MIAKSGRRTGSLTKPMLLLLWIVLGVIDWSLPGQRAEFAAILILCAVAVSVETTDT